MKKIMVLLLGLLSMSSCENGVQNTPVDNNNALREIKMVSATLNADGSYSYEILLPVIWENNLIQDGWHDPGVQIDNGDIQALPFNPDGSLSYVWKFNSINQDVFVNFGHYRYLGTSKKVEWANYNSLSRELTDFFIEKDGVKTLGLTLRNGGISKVNQASLVQLRAMIDINPMEARIGANIVFSGTRSTAQASPVSTISSYLWDFGDGVTASGQIANHSYQDKGDYTVRLTVVDNLGNANAETKIVHIFKMAFPANTLEGGDDYIQVAENRYANTITIYVNLNSLLIHGNHGKPFWWGTINGAGTPWIFKPIQPMPLNEDWGYIIVPFLTGREQFEFNYSDYYEYLDGDNRPVGVNWDHMSISKSKFYDPDKGHYVILVANQKVTKPY